MTISIKWNSIKWSFPQKLHYHFFRIKCILFVKHFFAKQIALPLFSIRLSQKVQSLEKLFDGILMKKRRKTKFSKNYTLKTSNFCYLLKKYTIANIRMDGLELLEVVHIVDLSMPMLFLTLLYTLGHDNYTNDCI